MEIFLLGFIFLIFFCKELDGAGMEVDPRELLIAENQFSNFSIYLDPDIVTSPSLQICWESSGKYQVALSDGGEARLEDRCRTVETGVPTTFHFTSTVLGIYKIRFFNATDGEKHYYQDVLIDLTVKREQEGTMDIVTILFTVAMVFALALMGLDIDVGIVVKTFKRPIGPAVGMLSQFLVMPIGSYLLGWLILENNYERLGLLLLGCSPGGANSNFWTVMFDGDVNLSVTMTFISSCVSFGLTTMWVYLLGTPLVDTTIPIPFLRLAVSLAMFTIPILLGVGFKHKWAQAGELLRTKVSRPFFLVCLLIMPTVGIWSNIHFFYLCNWTHLISGMLLGVSGFIFGALLAVLFKMEKPQIIAISFETAFQNGGISFIIVNLTFPSPYSDLAIMPTMGFFLCSTGPIMFVVYISYYLAKKILLKKKFAEVSQEEKNNTALDPL